MCKASNLPAILSIWPHFIHFEYVSQFKLKPMYHNVSELVFYKQIDSVSVFLVSHRLLLLASKEVREKNTQTSISLDIIMYIGLDKIKLAEWDL